MSDLVERLQRREHHFRHAVEGEYDANLLMKARFALDDYAARITELETALAEAEGRVIADVVAWLRAGAGQAHKVPEGSAKIMFMRGLNAYATALETREWKK